MNGIEVRVLNNLRQLFDISWKRFETAIKLRKPDRVPVNLHLGSNFLSWYTGITINEWYNPRSVKKQLEAQLDIYPRYPDTLAWPSIMPRGWPELSILGAKQNIGEFLPLSEPLIKKSGDLKRICVQDGLMPKYLNMFKYFQNHLKGSYEVIGGHSALPFDLAVLVRGTTQIMADLYLNPEMVHELLELCTEAVIYWLKSQYEVTGGSIRHAFLSGDFESLISPKHHKMFALPYTKRVIKSLPPKIIPVYHNDANASHIVDHVPEVGAKAFHMGPGIKGLGPDIGEVKEKIGQKVCLMGNIPPLEVLLRGTPKLVEEECKEAISKAGYGGGFCLTTGGDIAPATPFENLEAMVRTAEKYGWYPISL